MRVKGKVFLVKQGSIGPCKSKGIDAVLSPASGMNRHYLSGTNPEGCLVSFDHEPGGVPRCLFLPVFDPSSLFNFCTCGLGTVIHD